MAASTASPVWSMTTTASANAPSSMTWWPKAVPPSPCTAIRIGSVSTVSLGTVTTEAFSKELYACAATRSTGLPALPTRGSSRSTSSWVTPSGAVMSIFRSGPPATALPSCRPRRRARGVKRHSSSRPCGTGKSATS